MNCKIIIVVFIFIFFSKNLFALNTDEEIQQDTSKQIPLDIKKPSTSIFENGPSSISFEPIGVLLLFTNLIIQEVFNTIEEDGVFEFENENSLDNFIGWLAWDLNYRTNNNNELGFSIFGSKNNAALTTQIRSFEDKENLKGFFWGYYGLIEWRRLYWDYRNKSLPFPFNGSYVWPFHMTSDDYNNYYHSIGITIGADVGYRFNSGITPYIGIGIPLFFRFGENMPAESKNRFDKFDLMDIGIRAIHIGVRWNKTIYKIKPRHYDFTIY